MSQITIGVAEIAVGAIGVDGGMGTTLKALGYTEEGSAAITMADSTKTEFPVEEVDLPIWIEEKAGETTINFKVANPDEDTFVEVFGGTKTGTGAATVYDFPSSLQSIERSIKFTPKKGLGINIPRAKISAKLSGAVGRGSLLGVEVVGTILIPTKANTSAWSTFRVP